MVFSHAYEKLQSLGDFGVLKLLAVMVSCLQKINTIIADKIHDAVLLRQPPRPTTRRKIFERLGFSNSVNGVTHDGFDQLKDAQSKFAVIGNPIPQIFDKFRLKDSLTLLRFQAPPRGADPPCFWICPDSSKRVPKRTKFFRHFQTNA